MIYEKKPEPFLKVLFHEVGKKDAFGKTFSCSDYESKKWRANDFAEYLIEWLPEFALNFSEYSNFNGSTGRKLLKKAAHNIYTSLKKENRGEFGEILLHALIREHFNSKPVVSKVYYKTSSNDTVKGFDAVHLVEADNDFEIWLGEVKFYSDYSGAIRDVCEEIEDHLKNGFLRNEFMFIEGKIDEKWSLSNKFKELISGRISLDEIKKKICIPVLITYDTTIYNKYEEYCDLFRKDILEECRKIEDKIFKSLGDFSLKMHVFLVPLADKQELVSYADKKLKGLQE